MPWPAIAIALVDNADFTGIVAREWTFYKLVGSQLQWVQTLPGIGDGQLAGAFCDVVPPEPACGAMNCICDGVDRYVAFCTRFDERGASSTTAVDLSALGSEAFAYTVGHDLDNLVDLSLQVGVQATTGDITVYPHGDLNLFVPRQLYVQPWGTGLTCWSWQAEYRIKYRFANSGSEVVSPWKPSRYDAGDPATVANDFSGIPATSADHYPIQVTWQMRAPFGEGTWTQDPLIIDLNDRLRAPDLHITWPEATTRFNPGDTLTLSLLTQAPADTQGTYRADYSVWVTTRSNPAASISGSHWLATAASPANS